jgi:hypothetical protein
MTAGPLRRVAVPVDGSRGAGRAVRHVVNRAKREHGRLEVVLVGVGPRLAGAVPAPLARFLVPARATAAARTRDARALLEMHGIPYRTKHAAGDPVAAIAGAARELSCDEVVLGAGEGPAAGARAGELAARSGSRVTIVT